MAKKDLVKVFISYAWEKDPHDFKDNVWKLACWLKEQGSNKIEIAIDKLYEITPPLEGWLTWMHNAIQDADIVLVVCSGKYLERFNKRQPSADEGKGVSYEGAIINMALYEAQQKNAKFYPILPDGGDHSHIPVVLKGWYNGHTFPSKNDHIFKMVYGENPGFEKIEFERQVIKEVVARQEIEKEIIEDITPTANPADAMQSPTQILVQGFLRLNTLEKIRIAKTLDMDISDAQTLTIHDLDKKIFKFVKEKKLLHQLWDEINGVVPFENQNNPF